MNGRNKRILRFTCAFLIAVILVVPVSLFPLGQRAAAQSVDWNIIVDTSLNKGAVTGEVSNIRTGADYVRGDIVLTNEKALWWKVYISDPIGDVEIDTSNLFYDDDKEQYYFFLAPKGNSETDAIPTLPPTVTFRQVGSAVFFYGDRTIESGFEALSLQVTEIALIALTGSGVPTSAADFALQTLQAPPFVEAVLALGESPPNVWKVIEALASIATDSTALTQLHTLLIHLGIPMTISQIAQVFCFFGILQELVVLYDLFTSPYADNVAFQAVGAVDRPLIADIKCSPTSGSAPLLVEFDASDSYAPEYPIESYEWDFGDGETGIGITTTHTYQQSGNHKVTLTVTDTQGRQSTAERLVIVWQQRIQVTGEAEKFSLTFEGEDSARILSHSWDFGDGNTAEGRVVNNTYAHTGEYVVILSLGLDTGDTTQDWVPWTAWDVIKVTVQEDASPAGWSFSIDKYENAPETVALNGIIIEDADEVWTNILESSAGLDEVAQSVGPRIVLEYGDSMFEFGLQGSVDLNQAASVVAPRITVEYGDSVFELGLKKSEELVQVASTVSPRIIAEYADSIFQLSLLGSEDLNQVTSAVTPRVIVEYADSIFSFTTVAGGIVSIDAPDQVAPDSDFTANVNISEVVDFDACNYDVSFDASILRLDDITSGLIGSMTIPVDTYNEVSPGTWRIDQNVPGMEGVSGSGYLAVLHFHVIGSEDDSTIISLSNGMLANNLGEEILAIWVDASVVVSKAPLSVTTSDATNIGTNSATLSGNLDDLGTAATVHVSFEWGLDISYGNETTPQAMTTTGPFSFNLSVLLPNTTYHFRAKAVGDGIGYGWDKSFTTTSAAFVSIPDALADPAGTVTVPINITDVTDLGAADIWLSYNKNVVEVTNVADGDLGSITSSIDNNAGVTRMNWFSVTGESGNFTFAYVTLHAAGDPGDTSDLTLYVIELVDTSGAPIPHEVDDGLFTIRALMEGDVNMNGHVTISDAMLIAQHLVGIITLNADQLESADTTDDGNVTISDAMHIAQWLVDPYGTLGVLFKDLWESPADDHMLPPLP